MKLKERSRVFFSLRDLSSEYVRCCFNATLVSTTSSDIFLIALSWISFFLLGFRYFCRSIYLALTITFCEMLKMLCFLNEWMSVAVCCEVYCLKIICDRKRFFLKMYFLHLPYYAKYKCNALRFLS